jgi:hypothetical protein
MIKLFFFSFYLLKVFATKEDLVVGSDYSLFSPECANGICSSKILNPIFEIAFPNHNMVWTNLRKPNLVIRSPFPIKNYTEYTCPYINYSGEPYSLPYKQYPPLIEINTFIDFHNKKSVYIPHIINSNYNLSDIRKHKNLNRPYLVAYMNSNCQPHREQMFRSLVDRFGKDKVHALGKCSNNRKIENNGNWENAYDIYKDYTFTISMENTNEYGYITEKIMNAFIAGSIPLYFGSKGKINDFFNKDAFININDFSSVTAVTNYIQNLSEADIANYQFAPVFKNNKVPELLSLNNQMWIYNLGFLIRAKYEEFIFTNNKTTKYDKIF